jgi:hypothetical protein
MKRLLTFRNVVIVAAVAFLLWLPLAWVSGQVMAGMGVAKGKYKLLHYGLGPFDPRGQILQERYGIEYRRVADCVAPFSLMAYVDGYNRVSMSAANRRFGHDAFKEGEEDGLRWPEKSNRLAQFCQMTLDDVVTKRLPVLTPASIDDDLAASAIR